MLLNFPLSLYQIFLCLSYSYGFYYLYWHLTTGAQRRRLGAEHGCKPPKRWHNKDPILGLDFLWETYKSLKAHTALKVIQSRYEDSSAKTASFSILRRGIVSTIEPENLKSILSLDFKSWGLGDDRKRSLAPFMGEAIFTTDGAAWQHSRDMLRPNFVRSQYGDIEMFERHVQHLIEAIPRDGLTIDLQVLFFPLTLDIATEFLFGQSTGCLAPGFGDASTAEFVKAFTYCQNGHVEEGKWGFLSLFLPDPRLKRAYRTVHGFVDALVEKALLNQQKYESEKATSISRYVFIHELIAQTTDKIKIRSELLSILLAGRDTTASLLSNVWFELSQRPSVWSQLRAEVDALDNEPPTFERLKDMKYLRAILNESLRLYPVVPENDRQAQCDTILPVGGGDDGLSPVFVAKGQLAHWSLYTMHRRKDLYGEDAEEFKPERWLDRGETKGLRVGWEYLPFNGGPRICIGQQFALMEASYVTVRLMQEFTTIESKDPEPWCEKISFTCTGLGGCKVVLKPRT